MRSLAFLLLCVASSFAQDRSAPIENEYVRVVHANDQPHHAGAPHQHKQNRVMIYLDSGDIDLKYQDGKVDHQHWKAGQIAWSPAGGIHTSENVSDHPIRIVEIELRKEGATAGRYAYAGKRPIIDNAQVRVYRGAPPAAGRHYVGVNTVTGTAEWDGVPEGGNAVIVEIK